MNLENLKTFIAVSELSSFTKAATHMIVAQSTVTNRIKELENEMGQKLLERSNKNVVLTHAGKHLLSYAYRFIEMEGRMLDEINSIDIYNSRLNIGSVNCIYCCYLKPYIQNILDNHPSVQVNVSLTHSRDLMHLLNNDLIDIAFSYMPINDPFYNCTLFKEDEIVLLTSPTNDVYPSGIHNDQLIHLPIIYSKFAPKLGYDWIYDIFPQNHVFRFTISVMEKIIPFLLSGKYYAFLPQSLVQSYLDDKKLCKIDLLDYNIPKMLSYKISKTKSNIDIDKYL